MARRALSRSTLPASALLLALFTSPIDARAADLQLAVILDHDAPVAATLEALHARLRDARVSVEVALVHVRRTVSEPCTPVIAEGFTPDVELVLARIEQLGVEDAGVAKELRVYGRCNVTVDAIPVAIEGLKWRDPATKRLLALGRHYALFSEGRTTLEEAVGYAERRGIVLHAVEYVRPTPSFVLQLGPDRIVDVGRRFDRVAERYTRDVERFLAQPTAPLGRVPAMARHATVLSGGTFHVRVLAPETARTPPIHHRKAATPERRARATWTHAPDAWGPRNAEGLDALDVLARGLRRPSEVTPAELPRALAGVDLEPLLDAVHDYVDARRTLEELKLQSLAQDEGKPSPIDVHALLATELLEPRRLPPSRR